VRYMVRLQHGTYVATETVHADDDDEAIAKARARAKRAGFFCLPMAYESVQIIEAKDGEHE
jgi:hypothetical protein